MDVNDKMLNTLKTMIFFNRLIKYLAGIRIVVKLLTLDVEQVYVNDNLWRLIKTARNMIMLSTW